MSFFFSQPASDEPIYVYEVHNTRKELCSNIGTTLPTNTVKVAVPQEHKIKAKRALLGGFGTTTPGFPSRWPYADSHTIYHCINAIDVPDGGEFDVDETEKMKYKWHYLELTYAHRLGAYSQRNLPVGSTAIPAVLYIEDSWEPRTELRRLSHENLIWKGGLRDSLPITENEAPSENISGAVLTHYVSGFPFIYDEWSSLESTINDAAYQSINLAKNFGAGYLMLEHLNISAEFSHNSWLEQPPARVTYSITARYGIRREWNKFYRNDGGSTVTSSFPEYEIWNAQTNQRVFPHPQASHASILVP